MSEDPDSASNHLVQSMVDNLYDNQHDHSRESSTLFNSLKSSQNHASGFILPSSTSNAAAVVQQSSYAPVWHDNNNSGRLLSSGNGSPHLFHAPSRVFSPMASPMPSSFPQNYDVSSESANAVAGAVANSQHLNENEQILLEREKLLRQVEEATRKLNQLRFAGGSGSVGSVGSAGGYPANHWAAALSPEPLLPMSEPSSSSTSTGMSAAFYNATNLPFNHQRRLSTSTAGTSIDSVLVSDKSNYLTPSSSSSHWNQIILPAAATNIDSKPLVKLSSSGGYNTTANNSVGTKQVSEAEPLPAGSSSSSSAAHNQHQSFSPPPNYRKLMDKNVNVDWRLLVERIVYHDDQQASILMQHKLKVSSGPMKDHIIDTIVMKAYPLMLNRFGNFLVQRCLEYGNVNQICSISREMTGRVMDLAMDQFGCHVVQKALDCAPWPQRIQILNEMCSDIISGMKHRYASHVWQKLFELRSDDATVPVPSFMDLVNRELKGRWTELALTETGSLVVQNVFENCSAKDRINCVEEIIANLDTVIRGQWGNWVIQHMVEHAEEPYRSTVIDQVIRNAHVYSMDQFASKAMEKMLKMGDPVIIQSFLDRVVQKSSERPRIPLIDIASDAHGNYLVQYILQNGTNKQKEEVSNQIKKHMVSLRGSKWGYKCAWLIDKNRRRKE